MARHNAMRSIAPLRRGSAFPTSRRREGDSDDTGSSRETRGGALRRRNFMRTEFTATRYSQVEKAEAPRNEPTLRNNCKKASCVRSSASAKALVISKQKEYTSLL